MKGILKGSVFSLLLIALFISAAAFAALKADIPEGILKGVLWVLSGLCVFMGCLPVSRSAESKKLLKGLACALITVITIFAVVCIASRQIPTSGTFYAFALVCILCGFLGILTGAHK